MTFLFPSYHPVMKIGNMYRIQYHNHYIHIYKNQNFWLTSQLQISNDLSWNLPLNLLTMEFFFYLVFSFTNIHNSKTIRGRRRHLDISPAITAERLPLHIASTQTRMGKLWFPSASCWPLIYIPCITNA